jgi:hypothetical protein
MTECVILTRDSKDFNDGIVVTFMEAKKLGLCKNGETSVRINSSHRGLIAILAYMRLQRLPQHTDEALDVFSDYLVHSIPELYHLRAACKDLTLKLSKDGFTHRPPKYWTKEDNRNYERFLLDSLMRDTKVRLIKPVYHYYFYEVLSAEALNKDLTVVEGPRRYWGKYYVKCEMCDGINTKTCEIPVDNLVLQHPF